MGLFCDNMLEDTVDRKIDTVEYQLFPVLLRFLERGCGNISLQLGVLRIVPHSDGC